MNPFVLQRLVFIVKLLVVTLAISTLLDQMAPPLGFIWILGHNIGFVLYYILERDKASVNAAVRAIALPMEVEEYIVVKLDEWFDRI